MLSKHRLKDHCIYRTSKAMGWSYRQYSYPRTRGSLFRLYGGTMEAYTLTDETGIIIESFDNLEDACKEAKKRFYQSLREYGLIEHFKVWNNKIGTLAFVTGT